MHQLTCNSRVKRRSQHLRRPDQTSQRGTRQAEARTARFRAGDAVLCARLVGLCWKRSNFCIFSAQALASRRVFRRRDFSVGSSRSSKARQHIIDPETPLEWGHHLSRGVELSIDERHGLQLWVLGSWAGSFPLIFPADSPSIFPIRKPCHCYTADGDMLVSSMGGHQLFARRSLSLGSASGGDFFWRPQSLILIALRQGCCLWALFDSCNS